MEDKSFSIIAAVGKNNEMGKDGKLPWYGTPEYKEDIKMFKELTTVKQWDDDSICDNIVIMGRKTYESLPNPLPNRINIVVSKTLKTTDKVLVFPTLSKALDHSYNYKSYGIFVIGGSRLYKEAMARSDCETIWLTKIDKEYEGCDTFFPDISDNDYILNLTHPGKLPTITYNAYRRKAIDYDENQYINLMEDILYKGELKDNRTGVPTYSVFGKQLRFDLTGGVLPLITTKKMFYRGVVEELLFFLRGDHDNRKLQAKGVHIWDGNTSREGLDKYNKTHLQEHDLGLTYGSQWRAAGAKLETIDTDYKGKGVDQVAQVIKLLRDDPNSRRIIINAWNPEYLDDMALPPCHVMYQFYVSHNNKLSCMMTQRSADVFLGLPFNIASTATLVHILAKAVKMEPSEIVINLGDAHIYENHLNQVRKQLTRACYDPPKLSINKNINSIEDIEGLSWEDFQVNNYYSHGPIKAEMVA